MLKATSLNILMNVVSAIVIMAICFWFCQLLHLAGFADSLNRVLGDTRPARPVTFEMYTVFVIFYAVFGILWDFVVWSIKAAKERF